MTPHRRRCLDRAAAKRKAIARALDNSFILQFHKYPDWRFNHVSFPPHRSKRMAGK